jgi:hypothetical protein
LQFDVVDFVITPNLLFQPQNMPIGGSGDLGVGVTVQTPNGTPFPVAITPRVVANLSFLPATVNSSGNPNLNFTANVGPGMVPGNAVVIISASNHGVSKNAGFPINFFSAALTSTSLFVNDQANPLTVPVAVGAQPPDTYPQIFLRFNADFVGGTAPLNIVQPACGNFVVDLSPLIVAPNDSPTLRLYGAPGNTCPAGTRLVITAAIPDTQPPLNLPVYTLFVTAKGLPQLAVVNATPARDLSNSPWLSGEGLDWSVTVKNSGAGTSAGGEKVTIFMSNGEVGRSTSLAPIPAGQQANVNVHAVLHDVPEDGFVNNFMRVTVDPDAAGDLSPGFNSEFNTSVNVANWGIQVTSPNGASDSTPIVLLPGQTNSGVATIGVKNPAAFNPALSLGLVQGVFNQGQLNPPAIAPTTLTSAGTSNVTVGFPIGVAPVSGVYFVQVLAQMKDGGVVTAQRQATIHILIDNPSTNPGTVALASDRNNICPIGGCGAAPATPVQINGPLPEPFVLTATLLNCQLPSCPGTADISFNDTAATTTSPLNQTVQVTSPGNTLSGQVKANPLPDGNLLLGNAVVELSATAVQAQRFAARTPGPDPVGTNRFTMLYNIGDIFLSAPSCLSIAPQNPKPADFFVSLDAALGFNLPSVSWEWQDANHSPVGAGPLQFGTANGVSTLSGTTYTLPTFALTNVSNGIDGLQTYFFAVTVTNGFSSATKYFPIQVDLSTAQTACPVNLGLARGAGGTLIRGSWGKAGLIAAASAPAKTIARAAVSTKSPDLRINSSDITFTPSMPKMGDTVAIRFRISNLGDADATEVPVALQVNGTTVASDTFSVKAGQTTLGGLEWTNARIPSVQRPAAIVDVARTSRVGRGEAVAAPTPVLRAALVIDPQRTIIQKSTVMKTAVLPHFGLRDGAADAAGLASSTEQRVVLQLAEGACAGLKFALGAGGCTGDVVVTVEDLAKGTYKLEARNGIADLGVNNRQYTNAMFAGETLGQSGHTYAVQLSGGKVGLLTMQAVRNPDQLSEAAKRIFRKQVVRSVRSLGGSSGAPETGDTAPTKSDAYVYFDIAYEGI